MEMSQHKDFTELIGRAKEHHLKGELEIAIAQYTSLLSKHATSELHCLLGWAYYLTGNFNDAINHCRYAIELDANYGSAYNDLACYLIFEKRYDAAIPWLEKAVVLENYSEKHLPYYNLGRVYEKKGMWFIAKQSYEASLSLMPDYEKAKAALNRIYGFLN